MRHLAVFLISIVVLGLWPTAWLRADTALILSNVRYETAPQMRSGRVILQLQRSLSDAGFDVITVRNGTNAQMRSGLSRVLAANEHDRVVIVASGHFLRGGGDSWLLGVDVGRPDLAEVGAVGLPVSLLTEIAASAPGRAIVALATHEARLSPGARLEVGIGRVEPPQGVTVVAGTPSAITDFVSGPLLTPGTDLPNVLSAMPDLQAVGFLSSTVRFLPVLRSPAPVVSPEEQAYWNAIEVIGTAAAYNDYLYRYPDGGFADLAHSRMNDLVSQSPEARAEAAEAALRLTRSDRQEVQRYLTILGFDTRGVDGIFGPASRRAIAAWQRSHDLPTTGYLLEEQLRVLRNEGEVREAFLDEERRAEERADRNWWQATGAGRSLSGMRAYLERYPNGVFSERARQAISNADEAEAEEAWRQTLAVDTMRAYRRFIRDFPDSRRVPAAEARILELETGVTEEERARYAAQEAALTLPPIARLLVERRLASMGYDPGRVDGTFDAATRQAIRGYQVAQGMAMTGYLDQAMTTLLLAGSLGQILR